MTDTSRLAGKLSLAIMIGLLAASCTPDKQEPAEENAAQETGLQAEPVSEIPPGQNAESPVPELFRAIGTEPFWAIVRGNTGTRYSTPDNPEGTSVTIESDEVTEQGRVLTGLSDDSSFRIELTFEPCNDGMSDRNYPFTVKVKLDDTELSGCARPLDS